MGNRCFGKHERARHKDYIPGTQFEAENYIGAGIGGAAGAEALRRGAKPAVIGGITSGVEEVSTQALKVATGKQASFDVQAVVSQSVTGAALTKAVPAISGITAGSNSFQAVGGQIATKLFNGTIQQFTPQTASKILTSQFIGATLQAIITGGISRDSLFQGLNSQFDYAKKAVDGISKKIKGKNRN